MWPGAGDLDVLRSRTPTVVTTALVAGALTCGVVALAGPRRPVPGASLETEGINLLLVVDVSGSMAESDFDWNGESVSRLTAVKRAAAEFIAGRPQDRVGLILFAALPETASPLTADHAAVFQVLNAAARAAFRPKVKRISATPSLGGWRGCEARSVNRPLWS